MHMSHDRRGQIGDAVARGEPNAIVARATGHAAPLDPARRVVLVDFDFRSGIDLKRQRLPCGPEYLYLPDTAAAIRTGRAAIDRWAATETRRLATILLDMMADDLKMGQAQKLVRVPTRGAFAEPWRRLREALVD